MAGEQPLMKLSPCMFRNRPIRFLLLVGILLISMATIAFAMPISKHLSAPQDAATNGYVLIFFAAIFGLVCLWQLISWWIRCKTTRLVLMATHCVLYKGLLSRNALEMGYNNVQNVYVDQKFIKRLLGVGAVGLSSSGQANVEMVVDGIKNPHGIRNKIRQIVDQGRS